MKTFKKLLTMEKTAFFCFFMYLCSGLHGQDIGQNSDSSFPFVENLCFTEQFKEYIKISKDVYFDELQIHEKLMFKEKKYHKKIKHYFNAEGYTEIREELVNSENICPMWLPEPEILTHNEQGTTSTFIKANKYVSGGWIGANQTTSYNGIFIPDTRGGTMGSHLEYHTSESLNIYEQNHEVYRIKGFLTTSRYTYPSKKMLKEFVEHGFQVLTHQTYIMIYNHDIRITWHLEERMVKTEFFSHGMSEQIIYTYYTYIENLGQYLKTLERTVTPGQFMTGECYEIISETRYTDYSVNCHYTQDIELRQSTSAEKKDNATFSLFPNPASHSITLSSKTPFDNAEIVIKDMLGNIVLGTTALGTNSKMIEVPVAHLTAGTYSMTITCNQEKTTLKFIKI
jgi:hypothetical protein